MDQIPEHAIAIVGMSGRFPGAHNIEEFWGNVLHKKETITAFTDQELFESRIQSPNYVKARGILKDVEYFDADFFGIPPLEARLTDPQHRILLECALEALENAGYCPDSYSGSIGIYAGTSRSTYFLNNILPHRDLMETMGDYLVRIGNEQDFLTTKISYKLNLKGPSLTVQTACSTSLVAICTACNQLLTYQCDMALAGGVSIFIPQHSGYEYQKGMIFSPDGHCKPFDVDAQGTVPSNAAGIVVLKRLEDALEDKDHIYTVIRGYGMNNDGGGKMSFSAPSVKGQAEAIGAAISMAGIDPETIGYVEAHGTATHLGDPIEMDALTKAFRSHTQRDGFCAISSVKSNIGHSMEAAGVVGFIKAVLALKEKIIPPALHFNTQNPQINFKNSPFYVNTELKNWSPGIAPRRAGVSSFGIGGTNAHMILEEAPNVKNSREVEGPHLLILSAKTNSALNAITRNLSNYLKENPEVCLADVSFTLQMGRKAFDHRRAIACRNRSEAIESLLTSDSKPFAPQTSMEEYVSNTGKSWASGEIIDWQNYWVHLERKPSRISLPTYPFEKKRHWIDPPITTTVPQRFEAFPQNLELALLNIWKKFLGMDSIGIHDNFFTLGGDSLLAIQVITQIQDEIGFSVRLQSFYQFPTIAELAEVISQQLDSNSCIVQLKSGDERLPLFLIHGIDGNIFSFRSLVDSMSYKGPIFGIQDNSFAKKDVKIEEMASSYISEIKKKYPDGPYLICGFSFGGIIAYEISQQLHQMGNSPKFIGMIDTINPQYDSVPLSNDLEMLTFLIELLEGNEISREKNFLEERLLKSMGMDVLPENERKNYFERVQCYLKSLKHYFPKENHQDLTFFEAKDRFIRMKDIPLITTWRSLLKGAVTVREITGNHLNILKPPHLKNLAHQLDLSLEEALKK